MGSGFRLGSILGFEIRIDYSWFVIFFLVLWSLSAGFFPQTLPDRSPTVYFAMGAAGTVLFFASLLAHELSHSVVARAKGIPVEGITLFIFGGMARTRLESENPTDEILIAGVGPVLSTVLGFLFLAVAWVGGDAGWPGPVVEVSSYLGWINLLLAAFNLLPGFPLDGGRLFRAVAWKVTSDVTRATRWATRGGAWLGYGLMGLGVLQTFAGAVLGGLWLVFIGWFLRGAAELSFQQHTLRRVLEGVRAEDVMSAEPHTVSAEMSVQELVDDHFLRRRYQSFPVLDGDRLVGLVTLDQVKDRSREEWPATPVREVMAERSEEIVVPPDEKMTEVLSRMQESGTRRVLVARDDELLGIISGSDVTGWVQRAQERGVDPERAAPA